MFLSTKITKFILHNIKLFIWFIIIYCIFTNIIFFIFFNQSFITLLVFYLIPAIFPGQIQTELLRKVGIEFSLGFNNSQRGINESLVYLTSIIPIIGPIIMSIRLYYLLVDIKKRVEKGEIKLD